MAFNSRGDVESGAAPPTDVSSSPHNNAAGVTNKKQKVIAL